MSRDSQQPSRCHVCDHYRDVDSRRCDGCSRRVCRDCTSSGTWPTECLECAHSCVACHVELGHLNDAARRVRQCGLCDFLVCNGCASYRQLHPTGSLVRLCPRCHHLETNSDPSSSSDDEMSDGDDSRRSDSDTVDSERNVVRFRFGTNILVGGQRANLTSG